MENVENEEDVHEKWGEIEKSGEWSGERKIFGGEGEEENGSDCPEARADGSEKEEDGVFAVFFAGAEENADASQNGENCG